MVLSIVFLVLSVIGSVLTYFLSGLYVDIIYLWLPFVLVIGYWFGLLIVSLLFTLILCLFVNIKKEQKKPNRFFRFLFLNYNQLLLFFSRVKPHLIGREKLPKNEKNNRFLIVTNHISNYDHLSLCCLLHDYLIIAITKPELERIYPIGNLQHKIGFIPIDRDDGMKAMKSIRKAINIIRDGYSNVLVAPEGTRSKDGKFHEFHPLSFTIATSSKCPLVVISIKDTDKVKKNYPWKRSNVYLEVVKVIYPSEFENMTSKELCIYAHKLIENNLNGNTK